MTTLEEVLAQDLVLGASLMGSADFLEGVRAVLLGSTATTHHGGRHASLEEVSRAEVEDAFGAAVRDLRQQGLPPETPGAHARHRPQHAEHPVGPSYDGL